MDRAPGRERRPAAAGTDRVRSRPARRRETRRPRQDRGARVGRGERARHQGWLWRCIVTTDARTKSRAREPGRFLKQIDPFAGIGAGGGRLPTPGLQRASPKGGQPGSTLIGSEAPASGTAKPVTGSAIAPATTTDAAKEAEKSFSAGSSKITLPTNEAQTRHIFRDSAKGGHLPDTSASRQLLTDVANDQTALLGPDKHGNLWYGRTLPDGTQVWAIVRGGRIINGGLNATTKTFDSSTGLSAPRVPQGGTSQPLSQAPAKVTSPAARPDGGKK